MSGILGPTLASFLLLTAWIPFFLACAPTWQHYPFYAYGWAVPGLAFILFWNQIRRLQFGRAFQTHRFRPGDSNLLIVFIWTVVVLLAGASALTLRLVESTDPFWRFPLLLQAIWSAVICLLLGALLLGGPGARVLIGSQVVLAAATPLPAFLESGFVLPLNVAIGQVSAFILNLSGNPALLSGTELLQSTQTFSLNSTLGGINSFPAAIMFALFFGELFRLAFIPRGLLILLALVTAALGNLTRILWTFPHGPETLGSNYALSLTLLILLGVAAILRPSERDSLNPLPVLRWSPAFLFLILAWPTAELIHHFWWKEAEPRTAWTLSEKLPPDSHLAEPPPLRLHFETAQLIQFDDGVEILALRYAPHESRAWNEMNFAARNAFLHHLGTKSVRSQPAGNLELSEQLWPVECVLATDPLTGQEFYLMQLILRGKNPTDALREDAHERMILNRRLSWDGLLLLGRLPAKVGPPDDALARFEKAVSASVQLKKGE